MNPSRDDTIRPSEGLQRQSPVIAASSELDDIAVYGQMLRLERSVPEHGDPLIYPGLYSPSGFDIMGILVRVINRSDPIFDLGNIDSSCALLLCDIAKPDMPIVYCSEAFEVLTGYASSEILGRNCRFLQAPGGAVQAGAKREHVDDGEVWRMKNNMLEAREARTAMVNYRKGGARFTNVITTVPVRWGADDAACRYIVGFQAEYPAFLSTLESN